MFSYLLCSDYIFVEEMNNIRKKIYNTPDLDKLYQVLYQIQCTTNKFKKIQTLQNKLNEVPALRDVCIYLCDIPDITQWTKERLQEQVYVKPQRRDITTITDVLFYITYNQSCTDVDLANIKLFIKDKRLVLQDMIRDVICDSLNLGLTKDEIASAINYQRKAWRIPLSKTYQRELLRDDEYICVFPKLNGVRCLWDGKVLRSSSGLILNGLDFIIAEINSLNLTEYFIDGILIPKNESAASTVDNIYDITHMVLSPNASKTNLLFVIYDIVPLYGREKETLLYRQRDSLKRKLISNDCVYISTAKCLYEGTDHDMIETLLETNDNLIIYRDVVFKYASHNGILHARKRIPAVAEIVGCEEGHGRHEHRLGVLIVRLDNHLLRVSDGFNLKERGLIWRQRDKLIGSKCAIELRKDSSSDDIKYATFIKLIKNERN